MRVTVVVEDLGELAGKFTLSDLVPELLQGKFDLQVESNNPRYDDFDLYEDMSLDHHHG